MLQQRGDAIHCTECGREFDAQDESLLLFGECPSDDCPSNSDEEDVHFGESERWDDDPEEIDACDPLDIEFDH